MDMRIGWIPAVASALAFTCTPIWGADEPPAEPAWSSIQDNVKAEGLRMVTEGWADGTPQPLEDQYGSIKEWPWYRLTFTGGPQTYTVYSRQAPFTPECKRVSLVERAGQSWLVAKLGFEENSDRPCLYFPVALDGKAGSFVYADEASGAWKFVPCLRLFAWENSPESRQGGRLTVERLVKGRPQPLQESGDQEETGQLYRAIIQHNGQTYSFYLSETEPFSGRWIKVTRETFAGQECFRLSNLMDDFDMDIYLPIQMAGRYGTLLPAGDQDHTYILKSLDEVMEQSMQEYEALADEEATPSASDTSANQALEP